MVSAFDGVPGRAEALSGRFDLVVLDLMLPGRSGLDVLALSAAMPALPVIVLTARSGIEDRIAGLDAGAVDYLVKPFSLGELAARVRAQLRAAMQAPATAIRAGDIEVDLLTREVRHAGEQVRLSSTEFELLVYLLNNRGRVSHASRSSAPCGAMSTTRHERGRRLRRLPASQAQPLGWDRPDTHRACRGLSASAAPADRRAGAPQTPRARRPALAPGGLVRAGDAVVHGDRVRGGVPRHGQPAARPDRPRPGGRRRGARPQPHGCERAHAARSIRGGEPLHQRPAVQRQLDVAVRARAGRRDEHQPSGAVRQPAARRQ